MVGVVHHCTTASPPQRTHRCFVWEVRKQLVIGWGWLVLLMVSGCLTAWTTSGVVASGRGLICSSTAIVDHDDMGISCWWSGTRTSIQRRHISAMMCACQKWWCVWHQFVYSVVATDGAMQRRMDWLPRRVFYFWGCFSFLGCHVSSNHVFLAPSLLL